MANRWGIPKDVEKHVLARDKNCIYCGENFEKEHLSRKTKPTWEHIVNDIRINGVDNIALCCTSCNASKGSKLVEIWLESSYCKGKNINKETVSEVVRKAILNPPTL